MRSMPFREAQRAACRKHTRGGVGHNIPACAFAAAPVSQREDSPTPASFAERASLLAHQQLVDLAAVHIDHFETPPLVGKVFPFGG